MISWFRIIVTLAVVGLVLFGVALVVGNNLPDDNYSTDTVDQSPDGNRIIFVNDDMWDTPEGWEFVIEKSESGDDILILQPTEK